MCRHHLGFINKRIRKSQYFYIDIKREGVMLYDTGNVTLDEAKELTPRERHHLALEDYEYWMTSAVDFFLIHQMVLDIGKNNKAAFLLHQATEHFYSAMLLVFTCYKPNTHDLKKLSGRVASIEPEFLTVFPMGTEEERNRFKLLRQGPATALPKRNSNGSVSGLNTCKHSLNVCVKPRSPVIWSNSSLHCPTH
ncbi:HEPN domain-containing protein [Shewanella sp. YLB-07]|uniref:HEPN domain-containing protein n=1 Tax=Shewanella sp. YLB-07 TaxID=2601268 RepID=UPI00128E4385|nr:HEPN domain-containing protein [Shewanella sp. YLB-07]MPY24551.1 HEPN domain-containing protein [Shewanella sp. YLB-07]